MQNMLKILIFKVFTLIVILQISSVVYASEEISIEKPKEIIGNFQNGNIDIIYSQFDSNMAKLLSPVRLEPIWGQMNRNYGDFIGFGKQDTSTINGSLVTNTDLEFEKAIINFMLSFNKKNDQINGMYISEQEKKIVLEEKNQPLPDYIDTTKFTEEEIIVKDIYDLNGKVTIPKNFKNDVVFILVHGSGPQDMDGSFGKHKFLQNIAWGLSSIGYATVRYNKLTLQHGSRLVRENANITQDDEYNNSIKGAVNYVQSNNSLKDKKIILIGHSQGASAITAFSNNKNISGLILLSGSPRKLYDIYTEQLEYIFGLEGGLNKSEITILEEHKDKVSYYKANKSRTIAKDSLPLDLNYNYLIHLDKFDPIDNLSKTSIPVLVISGGHDYQVTIKDFELWKSGLGDNNHIKFKLIENVNHIYGETDNMSVPSDYKTFRPIAPKLFYLIDKWINKL